MKIQKFRYNNDDGIGGTEIPHKINNCLGRLTAIVKRNGYKPTLQTAQASEIEDDGIILLRLRPPKGPKRVKSSRGFRTYYQIICNGFDELQFVLRQLGYKNYKG